MTTVCIRSPEQLSDAVRNGSEKRMPIYPVAGRTQHHLLAPVEEDGIIVDLTGLNQLIDYAHRDLTITVQPGMTVQQIQDLLKVHHQTLPLDVPKDSMATVGGSIAANISGPRRTGWGTWRDYLIGLSWVNDNGEMAKAGGRVVKNVAGYDFCKLFTGSLGTLGVITQVTLKVKPMPEKCCMVTSILKQDALQVLSEKIRFSRLRPTLFTALMEKSPNVSVYFGFEDSGEAVDWQVRHLVELGLAGEHHVVERMEAKQKITELTELAGTGASVTFEVHVPGSKCVDFALKAQPFAGQQMIHPTVGLVVGHLSNEVTREEAISTIATLRGHTGTIGGHLTLTRCPPAWRNDLQPFGPRRADWDLMQKVKQVMDPRNIFQRGRYEILKAGSKT